MEALGRLFDLSAGFVPVDMHTGANTGKRISLRNAAGITYLLYKGAGTAGDDPVLTFQQHTALSGGTSSNLVAVDHYYTKSTATLAGTETWTRTAQTVSQTVTLTGEAANQGIYVFSIEATKLSSGYKYVSLNIASVGANPQLGGVLYALHDLEVRRKPANLAAALS